MSKTLNRSNYEAAPAAPIKLVHIGLGAFHRAHQVYYTAKAEQDPQYPQFGYASFTGRGPGLAETLSAQDGLYTLITRSGSRDDSEVIEAIVEAQPADNIERLYELVSAPELQLITLTVTEAGYHLAEGLTLNTASADVQEDIAALHAFLNDGLVPDSLATAASRVIYGLIGRRSKDYGGIAVMSCDNIAANGETTKASVVGMAREIDAELARWIENNISFPSSSIDRITPATEEEAKEVAEAAIGLRDESPVVTEPFASWVVEGTFPNGRPAWEDAGVQFVKDGAITDFENRKLWLLNGSHSLMAYYGQIQGHTTVAQAINDPEVRSKVEALWDEAANHLTANGLRIPAYREALIERFENPRIRHNLAQIAIDGATKQRMRALAIFQAERAAGRSGEAAAFSIAAWIAFVLNNEEIKDSRVQEIEQARASTQPVRELIAVLDASVAADETAVELISSLVEQIGKM